MYYLFVTNIFKYADSWALFTGSAHKLPLSLEQKKMLSFIKNKNFLMQREACMSDLGLKYAIFVEFPSAPEVPLMGAWHSWAC